MKYLKDILFDFFAFFIALSLFNNTNTRFETNVIALLVLIYINILGYFTLQTRSNIERMLIDFDQNKKLRKELKIQVSEDEDESYKELEKKYKDTQKQFNINSIFWIIMSVLAVFKILLG